MSGEFDKAKGAVKETVGKATGDKKTEAEGKFDKAKGYAKDAAHDLKEHVKDRADENTRR
jgi:uncharacterized protein YjbJ (UPF0337 family)